MTDLVSRSLPVDESRIDAALTASPVNDPLNISGELSIANLQDLQKKLLSELGRSADMRIDFSGVTACDTAAVQLICSLFKSKAPEGHALEIVALSPAIFEMARVLGVSFEPWGDAKRAI